MRKINWEKSFELWSGLATLYAILIGVPLAAIWLAFHFDHSGWGWLGIILVACWLLQLMAVKVLNGVLRLVARLRGQPDPKNAGHVICVRLWAEMYRVWETLAGPVINPTMLRDAMRQTADHGAVWPQAAWTLIDRIVAADPTALLA